MKNICEKNMEEAFKYSLKGMVHSGMGSGHCHNLVFVISVRAGEHGRLCEREHDVLQGGGH